MEKSITVLQKQHLIFLQSLQQNGEWTLEGHEYLKQCIEQLQTGLTPYRLRQPQKATSFDPVILEKYKQHFDLHESIILTYLTCNQKPLTVSEMVRQDIGFDRTKSYRAVLKLGQFGLVIKIVGKVTKFTLANRKAPLEPYIAYKQEEIRRIANILND